jgi:hypothetical protein
LDKRNRRKKKKTISNRKTPNLSIRHSL